MELSQCRINLLSPYVTCHIPYFTQINNEGKKIVYSINCVQNIGQMCAKNETRPSFYTTQEKSQSGLNTYILDLKP